jgi:hypothetical protein
MLSSIDTPSILSDIGRLLGIVAVRLGFHFELLLKPRTLS